MWVFTETGFVSAVRKNAKPEVLTVRSRDRESLIELAKLANTDISLSPLGDYPYRIEAPAEVFAKWAYESAINVDYDNFKNHVKTTRDDSFESCLANVWVAMLKAEDAEALQARRDWAKRNA